MKNQIRNIVLVIVMAAGQTLPAQNFYLGFGTGYCHSAAPNLYSDNDYEDINGTETSTRRKGSGSFGRGGEVNVFLGYTLNEMISTELGLGYFYGLNNKSIYVSQNQFNNFKSENTIRGRMIRINPVIRFNAGNGKMVPYIKAGAVIGVAGKLHNKSQFTDSDPSQSYTMDEEMVFSGRTSIGFTGALGIQFTLSEKIGFFSEIHMITQSWAPKRSEITKQTVNGMDMLPDLSTSEKETEYVDKYTESDDNDSPSKELKYFMPFSSIGLQIGLVFKL